MSDTASLLRAAPFGSSMSMMTHYSMYASFARLQTWQGTAAVFERAVEVACADPRRRGRKGNEAWVERIRADVVKLQQRDLFGPERTVEDIVQEVHRARERMSFQTILLHIYADDPEAQAEMITVDPDAVALAREACARHGSIMLTGPHVGPFHGLVPVIVHSLGLDRSAMVMMYRSTEEWEALRDAYAQSDIPVRLRPLLIHPEHVVEQCTKSLLANTVSGMLSDATQPGKAQGGFRARLFGRETYAPSGPVRIAHAAQRPLYAMALLPRSDGGFRLRLEPVFTPDAEPLTDERIQAVLDSKWAIFERYIREAPASWHAIGAQRG